MFQGIISRDYTDLKTFNLKENSMLRTNFTCPLSRIVTVRRHLTEVTLKELNQAKD